ncbi:hypothetical protein ACHWQZ_G017883 [Mnemiopsis leidyi]
MGLKCYNSTLTFFLVMMVVSENLVLVESIMGVGSAKNIVKMMKIRRRLKGLEENGGDTDHEDMMSPNKVKRSYIKFSSSD